jgi:hypothetical protein
LGAKALQSILVPLPSFEMQLCFDRLHAEFDITRRLQTEASLELDGLLPALVQSSFEPKPLTRSA